MERAAPEPLGAADGIIDLGLGHPDEASLPYTMIWEAAAAGRRQDALRLQYGLERGELDVRRAIADFVGRQASSTVDPDRLFVTAGATSALQLACDNWSRPGDVVVVEDPTYHLALAMFRDRGLKVVSLPGGGADGISLDALERLLESPPGNVAFLYLVPFFANPAGSSLQPDTRSRLLERTRAHGVTVLSDEVYRFLGFDGGVAPSLAGPEAPHVLALNSFSKLLAPGLRLGWLEADEERLARLEQSGYLRSGGGLNPFVASCVRPMLDAGALDAHVASLRAVYADRAEALAEALRAALPTARFRRAEGGYFLWLELPGIDTAALRQTARRHGVDFVPGARFRAGGAASQWLRVGFSYYPSERLRLGAERLGHAVADARRHQATITSAP